MEQQKIDPNNPRDLLGWLNGESEQTHKLSTGDGEENPSGDELVKRCLHNQLAIMQTLAFVLKAMTANHPAMRPSRIVNPNGLRVV